MKCTIRNILCSMLAAVFFATLYTVPAYAETFGDWNYYVNNDGTATLSSYKGNEGAVTAVEIPEYINGYSVTRLDGDLFKDCDRITSVYISKKINYINRGGDFFDGCDSLVKVEVDKDNTEYDSRDNCNAIIETAGNCLVAGCANTVIPYTVKCIGTGAFCGCHGLKNITIPASVTSIENRAFAKCTSLKKIEIPHMVTIPESCFYNCTSLKEVSISVDVEYIENSAFMGCSSLERVVLPPFITLISPNAFSKCTSLKSVVFTEVASASRYPDLTIGSDAFSYCESLEKITFPSNLYYLGTGVLSYCNNLKSIKVDGSNSNYYSSGNCIIKGSLNKTLVQGCNTSVIPKGVGEIAEYAFTGFSELKKIEIPSSVRYIYSASFANCPNIESIVVDSLNTTYDSRDNCNAIVSTRYNSLILGCMNTVIPNTVTTIGVGAFADVKKLTSMVIPNSVTTVGEYAFSGCEGLTNITIGSGVTQIESLFLNGCTSLEEIKVDKENTVYDSRKDCNAIIKTKDNELIIGCKKTVIPDDVTSIAWGAFTTRNVEKVKIPDSAIPQWGAFDEGTYLYCSKKIAELESVKYANYIINDITPTTIKIAAKTATYTGKAISVKEASVIGSTGAVTYTYYTDSKLTKKTTKSKSGAAYSGGAPTNVGTYYVVASVAADEINEGATSSKVKLTIKKAQPTIKVKTSAKSYTVKALSQKNQTFSIGASVDSKAKLTYKATATKNLSIDKNGKITVKKGTKKGTYELKVTVNALAGANHLSGSKTFTINVTVK